MEMLAKGKGHRWKKFLHWKTGLAGICVFLCLASVGHCETPALSSASSDTLDAASGINIASLSATQVENLVVLGQVWGFLKYHHPAVTAGQRNWDRDLFQQLPAVLSATDRRTAAAALIRWIDTLGPSTPCISCVVDASGPDVQIQAAPAWLSDTARLTSALSERLLAIRRNRSASPKQFYVSFVSGVKNPKFDNESAYSRAPLSDSGFRLLAVYRFWNIIEYWFPYRDVMAEDWPQAMRAAIVEAVMAPDAATYQLELMALIAKAHDTHANLWSSIPSRPPAGDCKVPVELRFLKERLIVASVGPRAAMGSLEVGDEILEIDGKKVTSLVQAWRPYYAASNDAAMRRDMARNGTQAACQDASLRVRRRQTEVVVVVGRVPKGNSSAPQTHDRPGEAFQMLSPDIAYLKLSNAKRSNLAQYITAAAGTKGLVVDLRNYPAEFMVLQLAGMLVSEVTPFARFTMGDPANPGLFRWTAPFSVQPAQPYYAGKLVILVDEITQSQAEYTAMALRAVPGALVVGSMTAGADGNMSFIPLPSNLRAAMSGIGVFYPSGRPTQRVGIVPDIEVYPTIEGLRAGVDEVLDTAVRAIHGK